MTGIGHNSQACVGNWIAVSRDSRSHPEVGMGQPVKPANPARGSYSRYEAWHDLLMEAQWRPFEIRNKGKVVMLNRGQLLAARVWLAERWNWTEKTVRGFLSRLENAKMVVSEMGQSEGQSKGQRKGHYSNVLTICNYNIYQTMTELMSMTKGQSEGLSEGQSRAKEGPESNKETREQEERKIPPVSPPRGDGPSPSVWIAPDGLPKVVNGKRAALEKILGGRLELDLVLAEVAPKVAASPPEELWTDLAAAVAEAAVAAGKSKRKPAAQTEYSKEFGFFWEMYPRREGKGEAFKKWEKLTRDQQRKAWVACKAQLPVLTAKARDRAGNFCPLPATWLHQNRFDDDVQAPASQSVQPRDRYPSVRNADEAFLEKVLARDLPEEMPRPAEEVH